MEIESYTIFNIPLGFFYGSPDLKLSLNFNQLEDEFVEKTLLDDSAIQKQSPIIDLTESEDQKLWLEKTTEDGEVRFWYPETLTTKYISEVTWPPIITLADEDINSCEETPAESSLPFRVSKRLVDNNRWYCVTASSEGAAGSVYTEYTYKTTWQNKVIELYFVLQYPRCDNYPEDQQIECSKERESFDLDALIDRIVLSLQ